MENIDKQLPQIIEDETHLFCKAEDIISRNRPKAPADELLHVRLPNCGSATSFIQYNLEHHHNISVDRLYGEPESAPRLRYNERRFGHVILRHADILIDPTYGQLFEYAGINASNPVVTKNDYPSSLALFVDLNDPGRTIEPLATALDEATQKQYALSEIYAPFRSIGKGAIASILYDIYALENYSSYPVRQSDPSYDYNTKLIEIGESIRSYQEG